MHFGGPTPQEDVKLSLNIQEMGYFFGNVCNEICVELSFGNTDDYYDYYCRTFSQRGHGIPDRSSGGKLVSRGNSGRDHI